MINQLAAPLLKLSRLVKRLVAIGVDVILCVFTVWLALYFSLESWVVMQGAQWLAVGLSLALALPIFVKMGLYRAIFRYADVSALTTVTKAVFIYGVAYAVLLAALDLPEVPHTVGLLQPLLLLLAVGASRALGRYCLSGEYMNHLQYRTLSKVLIYGAGSAGRQLAGAMANDRSMRAVGFFDDDDRLHGQVLNGLRIYNPAELAQWVARLEVSDVLLAMPSTTRQRRNEILEQMRNVGVVVRTLPGLMDLAQGRVQVSDLLDLDIDDLLGRDSVPPNALLLGKNIRNKVVLVTGAGGSIGSELCRQIIRSGPTRLLLVDSSEFALYTIHHELIKLLADEDQAGVRLLPLLASVRDEDRMREIMHTWRPHTIYHAAAYKHVPMVEHNPAEGVKNNALGTWTVARLALDAGVRDFVLISTDKAVRPTNIMGASKRLAEMILQALATAVATQAANTRFSMVRFGNVLGSSGSVVPLFRKQIKANGPITLTHADITRYFMTIPEAAQLVIQAGSMASGGDVFVLDMGAPVRIIDLARRMVELSGLSVRDEANPAGDIAIEITGLRPGEKLYEELLIGDNPLPTKHPRIMKAHEEFLPLADLTARLQVLKQALNANDVPLVRTLLKYLVPGYQPDAEVVDWVHLARAEKPGLAPVAPAPIAWVANQSK
ncbi:polysaccharide biosynthesis protein [Rhodoferax sp.]|uniref:polysaccharide biosynthesis protein n=1 Tax=Rhodoferax sp. TaxID=50421 RepID=UPI00374D591B